MDGLDFQYIALEAQRRMAEKLRDRYLDFWHNPDDHNHIQHPDQLAGEQQHFLDVHTRRLDALLRLFRVRRRTPPDYDDYRECRGAFAFERPRYEPVVDVPVAPPAPAAPGLEMLPLFKPKRGRRKP